jgi:class 3 adenylate cyclase
MKVTLKRFGDEFYFYSSQLVIFFMVILFMTSGSGTMGVVSSLLVALLLVIQTILLVGQGHKPLLRVLFSFVAPVGYSILRAATGAFELFETANVLLWGSAFYVGLFQAIALSAGAGFIKKVAETALALGAAVIFIFFYFYLDLRLNLAKALADGTLDQAAYAASLHIRAFPGAFKAFSTLPQHWFAALSVASFDALLLAARMREITLRTRLDRAMERQERIGRNPEAQEDESVVSRSQATVLSSDILAFSDLSERIGVEKSAELLNRYYSMWMQVAGGQGGRIVSITGDSVILVFGLADEKDNAERGLAAAYTFMDELPGLRDDLAAAALPSDLRVSIGAHAGTVVSGKLGPAGDRRRGVFGDAIAVAARLDSLCRELNQDLLVSHTVFRRLGLESQATLERIGEVLLRKSTRPVPVYGRK